jgi:dipeptide transport system ATP-binding protein
MSATTPSSATTTALDSARKPAVPLLEVTELKKYYDVRRFMKPNATVKALDGVSFRVEQGKTLAIVGESGCGKSTLAKTLMLIEDVTSGSARLNGTELSAMPASDWRRQVQMIFQDPYSSLNPRKKALDIIAEPLIIAGTHKPEEVRERARQMMAKVGLRPEFESRYPHMFSGGQRQRLGIARALMLQPLLLICDEPVSALDVSIQAQVLNLLMDLQDEFKLSYLFISHDLSIVRHIADDVLVMYLGQVMELGARERIFTSPQHPYTKALMASHPDLTADMSQLKTPKATLEGELPSPLNPPTGCPFQSRCPYVMPICREKRPPLYDVDGRKSACFLHDATSANAVAKTAPERTT